MGMDLWGLIEARKTLNDPWEFVAEHEDIPRNYALFEFLGVDMGIKMDHLIKPEVHWDSEGISSKANGIVGGEKLRWVTLESLRRADVTQTVPVSKVISLQDYIQCRLGIYQEWPGETSEHGTIMLTRKQADIAAIKVFTYGWPPIGWEFTVEVEERIPIINMFEGAWVGLMAPIERCQMEQGVQAMDIRLLYFTC